MSDIRSFVDTIFDELVSIRRDIHAHPELGMHEVRTSALIRSELEKMGVDESEEATELLKSIGDFERISDHAVNILESAEELRGKSLAFSAAAAREYDVLAAAIGLGLWQPAFFRELIDRIASL